jgi:hypothetical protein
MLRYVIRSSRCRMQASSPIQAPGQGTARTVAMARRVALPDLRRSQSGRRRGEAKPVISQARPTFGSRPAPLSSATHHFSPLSFFFFAIFSLSLSMPRLWLSAGFGSVRCLWLATSLSPAASHLMVMEPHPFLGPFAPPHTFSAFPFVFDKYMFQVIPCFSRVNYVSTEYLSSLVPN